MQKFRDNRLGAFIHWGLYAIPGGEWNGKMYGGAAEWLKSWAKVPADEWLKPVSYTHLDVYKRQRCISLTQSRWIHILLVRYM